MIRQNPLLSPSSAILRYLVTKYRLPDHWYPTDVAKRARVDEYLGWHSSNLRVGAAELIFSKVTNFKKSKQTFKLIFVGFYAYPAWKRGKP